MVAVEPNIPDVEAAVISAFASAGRIDRDLAAMQFPRNCVAITCISLYSSNGLIFIL